MAEMLAGVVMDLCHCIIIYIYVLAYEISKHEQIISAI